MHFNDDSGQQKSVPVNQGSFDLQHGSTFGVGFIFKSKKVLFTANGKEIDTKDLPVKLQNKLLYPAISVGSREHHKVEINLGLKKF